MSEENVRRALAQVLNSDRPMHWKGDYRFLGDAVDSLDHAAFVLALQENFGLHVADADVETLYSVDQVVAYARSRGA